MARKMRVRNHKVVLNRSAGGDAGITTMLVILGVLMFIPMYFSVMTSLKPLDELWIFPPKFYVINPTFKNYSDLFKLMSTSWVPFSRYIFNTVLITVAGTFGNLCLGSLAAYALSKIPFPGRKTIFQMIVLSLMFVSTVTGIANFITFSFLGLVDNLLAIILPASCSTLGLYLMKQFMDSSVSNEALESARLDGAGEFRVFWSIAMPMVKPAWLTLIVYSFQGLWNTGSSIYIQSEQLKTFNYAIQQILSAGIVRAGASTAAMVIMMIVPVTVFIISQSNIIETMASSGMKD
ncbi:MAG: carbohydrate ABC transporter permease [Clostridia bacterium]|nr:carbohydrate ABC transporter permease [Clostridia bacterium]MBP5208830.1 carbohydrate ABC transporter permease [Clostridia bacterium]